MPTAFRQQITPSVPGFMTSRDVALLVLFTAAVFARAPAAAQIKLSPTLVGQYATSAGLVLDTDSPEWYVGQDVYINYQITNLTSETAQNLTLTYAIPGLVPYDYTMAMSG